MTFITSMKGHVWTGGIVLTNLSNYEVHVCSSRLSGTDWFSEMSSKFGWNQISTVVEKPEGSEMIWEGGR